MFVHTLVRVGPFFSDLSFFPSFLFEVMHAEYRVGLVNVNKNNSNTPYSVQNFRFS